MPLQIHSSRNFDYFNRLANHPDITPFIRDDSVTGEVHIESLNTAANIFLEVLLDGNPVGFAILIGRGWNCYELHSGVLPEHRGATAMLAGKAVLRWLFINTDAQRVSTWAWNTAKHVLFAARYVGFQEEGRMVWPNTVHNERVERVMMSVTLDEWARKFGVTFVPQGMDMGLGLTPYNAAIGGIFGAMAIAGQLSKAEAFFNRWTPVTGCQPVQVLGLRAGNAIFSYGQNVFELSPDLVTTLIERTDPCHSQQP